MASTKLFAVGRAGGPRVLGGVFGLFVLLASALVVVSGSAAAQSPPGTPESVSVTRADGTLTASWPAVSGATGYHITYSSDGKQSWSLAAYDHAANSITINGVTNSATYVVGVRALNAGGGSGWRNSPAAGPWTPPPPPATPESVSVTRADGTLTASWPAASGATGYHITYSSNGKQSWNQAAYDHSATSITINEVTNSATYVVGVRALNAGGGSGWRNSPAAGPWTPPSPPATPDSVTVTRADGTLTASWPAADGATGYHITYSSDGKQTWNQAAYDHSATSITINGVSNSAAYVVAVRALNASGGSGWRNSPSAEPWMTPPATPASVSVLRSDGSLKASWPAVEGATGYHITYSSDGKQSWNQAAYDHSATSITINGVTNSATYVVGVRALNAGGGSGWRNSPAASAWTSPGAVEGLGVSPGSGYFDISWDALTGATGYDIRAKTENSSTWHDVAANVSGTSHRYTTAATLDFIAVRARSNANAGPWAEISRMPSEDFWAAYDAQTAGAMSLGGGQGFAVAEAQAASTKLGAPTWGKITVQTRGSNSKAKYVVNWTPVTGADGYNFVCSMYGGWHWDICGWEDTASGTVEYTTVPNSKDQPITISHIWRKDGPHTPGKYELINRHFLLAVRAVKNNDPSAASPWTQTENIPPFLHIIGGFSHTRGDGHISMSWTPNFWITGYDIYCAVAISGQAADYKLCATMSDQVDTASQHSVTISNWTVDGTSYSIDNTKMYDIAIYSKNKWGRARWLPPLMGPITLTASSVTTSTATLTLREYTGTWWLKRTTPADTNCKSMGTAAATGATEDLTSLTPGTPHTYKAYSDSSCTNEIVSGSFTTPVTVSSINTSATSLSIIGHSGTRNEMLGQAFTTGSNTGGYTFSSVEAKSSLVIGSPGNVVVKLHAASTSNNGINPGDELSTLDNTDFTPNTAGSYTFTCTTNCVLAANTTYFVSIEAPNAPNGASYYFNVTNDGSETKIPATNGWSIADDARLGVKASNHWQDNGVNAVQVILTAVPS